MNLDYFDGENVVSSMIERYKQTFDAPTDHPLYLPEQEQVIRATETLRQLLFPGLFCDHDPCNTHRESQIAVGLMEAMHIFRQQVCHALNLCQDTKNCAETFATSKELCNLFFEKIHDIRQRMMTDVQAAFDGDPAAQNEHEIILAYPGIVAISIYRLAHALYSLDVPLIPRMMTEYAHGRTGIDIHPGATIGRYFFIDHGTGVVIGETAQIGDYVKIYQGVTLGALSTRGGQRLSGVKRHPTLEDEVTVYSGASILGGETVIGKGCVIGGNVFLTQSVPPGATVRAKNMELEIKQSTKQAKQ